MTVVPGARTVENRQMARMSSWLYDKHANVGFSPCDSLWCGMRPCHSMIRVLSTD